MSADDKKRVIVEAQGNLKYELVVNAIRMLGDKFFHEVQGQQRNVKTKTYDVNYVQDNEEDINYADDQSYVSGLRTVPRDGPHSSHCSCQISGRLQDDPFKLGVLVLENSFSPDSAQGDHDELDAVKAVDLQLLRLEAHHFLKG